MGFFSRKYETSGVGISKDEVKKKGLALFFDILGRKFWNLMQLNLIFMIFFIPPILILPIGGLLNKNFTLSFIAACALALIFMITIGPALAGMTKVIRCFVLGKHTFVWADFWRGFKSNFKLASIVGFIDCIALLSAFSALTVYPQLAVKLGTKAVYIPMVITLSLFIVIIMMNFYIIPMMTATTLGFKNLVKNSFALAFIALKQNFITFIIILATGVGLYFLMHYLLSVFLLIIPFFPAAILCLVSCFNSYPVIQKYVINPYYTSIGKVNPELLDGSEDDEERIFEDMGGKEKPIENSKKAKGKRIS